MESLMGGLPSITQFQLIRPPFNAAHSAKRYGRGLWLPANRPADTDATQSFAGSEDAAGSPAALTPEKSRGRSRWQELAICKAHHLGASITRKWLAAGATASEAAGSRSTIVLKSFELSIPPPGSPPHATSVGHDIWCNCDHRWCGRPPYTAASTAGGHFRVRSVPS